MKQGLYKIATLISIANFVSCTFGGITITTSFIRSVIVFIGMLFVLFVLHWNLTNNFFLHNVNQESIK